MNEKPTQIGVFVTNDFRNVIEALDILCVKKYLDRSRIIRSAIRKEVQELLKQYPDVAEELKEYIKRVYNPLLNFGFTIPFHDTCYPSVSA